MLVYVDDARAGSANRRTRMVTWGLVLAHVVGGLACARAANSFLTDYSMEIFFSVVLSQAGLLGMWLGLAGYPWKNRLFSGLLGLAYLAIAINSFIPPGVPLVATLVYSMLMPVPCLAVALFMGCLRWYGVAIVAGDDTDARRPGLQFSIRHLLILTTVVALIFAFKPTDVEHTMLTSLVLLAAIGLCATCVVLGALWAALVAGHPGPRIPVVLSLAAFMGTLPPYYVGMKLSDTASMAAVSCIQATIIISSLLVIRSLGYRLVRQNQDGPAHGASKSAPSTQSRFLSLLVVVVTIAIARGHLEHCTSSSCILQSPSSNGSVIGRQHAHLTVGLFGKQQFSCSEPEDELYS